MSDAEQEQWFTQEVQANEQKLRAYLRKKFPTLEDVDDIIQDAYSRLLKASKEKPIKEPTALLYTIARNLVYDLFRRRKVVKFESLTQISGSFVVDTETDVEETVSLREEIDLLVKAVEALPKRCRQVMTLRMIYGHSRKEIARQLGVSEHTVKAQLAKGILRCSEFLSRNGDPLD